MNKDPYIYDDIPVLKNKFNIKDKEKLNKIEYNITASKLLNIDILLKNKIDTEYIKKIHKHIFEDIYEWAGEYRKVDIYKPEMILLGQSIQYSKHENIENDLTNVLNKMNSIKWNDLSIDEKVDIYPEMITEIWKVHPFREGNTRTSIIFATHYAFKNEFYIDREILLDFVSSIRQAFVLAAYDKDYDSIKQIFEIAIFKGELEYCNNIIKEAGYKPEKSLAEDILFLNDYLKKHLKVEDILKKYKNIENIKDKEEAEMINNIANKFIEQEKRIYDKHIDYENDL